MSYHALVKNEDLTPLFSILKVLNGVVGLKEKRLSFQPVLYFTQYFLHYLKTKIGVRITTEGIAAVRSKRRFIVLN